MIVAVGLIVSVDCVAMIRLASSVPGWMPMSANMLTIACFTFWSSGVAAPSCWSSRPQDQKTVPAPKTSAPLSARYMVRLWVASAEPTVVP